MTTTINKTDGSVLTTIPDGAVDISSTNIALVGRLFRNYGELINENLVKLLENFANSSSPSTPIIGQLWFDTSEQKLKVFRSTGFVSTSVSTTSTNEPSNASIGDFWYDTVDAQLKLYNGTRWNTVSPSFTASQGKSGAFVENITDTNFNNHTATLIYQNNQIVSIFSNDNDYVPQSAINGFPIIRKGLTLSSLSDPKFHGTATNATQIGGISASQFLRNDQNSTATGTISLTNTQPLVLGPAGEQKINVTSATTDFVKSNSGLTRFYVSNDLVMQLNSNGQIVAERGNVSTPSITFNGNTDTGVYWPAANSIGFSAGGANQLTVSPAGVSVTGTLTAANIVGNISVSSGNINSLSTTTLTAPTIIGNTVFDNNVLINGNFVSSGNTILGNSVGDVLTINAGTLEIPNGIVVSQGNIVVDGSISTINLTSTNTFTNNAAVNDTLTTVNMFANDATVAGNATVAGSIAANNATVAGTVNANLAQLNAASVTGNIIAGNNLSVNNELLVQFDPDQEVAAFRVDADGRILINVEGPAITSSAPGDVTLGDFAHIYSANTAKWWIVWKDNEDPAQFEVLQAHRVLSVTRESAAGEYRINLEFGLTPAGHNAVVGMGAFGNMNMLEYPVGGDFVRVRNVLSLSTVTGTRGSSYNSVVSFGT